MLIEYRGHSEFLLTSLTGVRLLTDPCDPDVGYAADSIAADAVTVSHDHFDHNYLKKCLGEPEIVREKGLFYPAPDVTVEAIPCFHDEVQGKKRGSNLMMKITMDRLTVLHMGDLGHPLDDTLLRKIGRVDILMIPVGGFYTIGPKEAADTVSLLRPRITIPMHYQTQVNEDWPIAPAEDFLIRMHASSQEKIPLPLLRVARGDITEQPRLCLLNPRF